MQLLFAALVVSLELTSAEPINKMGAQVATTEANDPGDIQNNFRNLLDSITKKDTNRRETYRDALAREAVREQQAFNLMKEELQFTRLRNAYKENDSSNKDGRLIKEKAADVKKRAVPENGAGLGVVAVAELSNFRPPMAYADEIIEHVFLKSLNASEPRIIEAAVANSTHQNVSSAELGLPDMKEFLTNTSITNISSNSTVTPKKIHGNLLPVFKSKEFRVSEDKQQYLRKYCDNITWDNINEIALKTVKQFEDPTYLILRKYRLTASSFGTILKAIRRNSYPPSLYKKLLGFYSLQKVPAIRWGKFHESFALDTLRNLYPSWNIKQAGLYLHESGLLGASPDGITDECIIEIKCPYRFRRGKNLEEFLLPETKYIIERSADGAYYANPSHEYYDQIQAEILFSRRQYGVLFIWTPNEAKLFRIEKDHSWAKNIDLILDFYMNKFVPYISNMKKDENRAFYMTRHASKQKKNENETYLGKFEPVASNFTKNENMTKMEVSNALEDVPRALSKVEESN